MKQRFALCREWITEMGAFLRNSTGGSLKFSEKTGHQDIVTVYDRQVEQFFRSHILEFFPTDLIVGEEFDSDTETADAVTWYIDPIDGTTNFVNLRRHFAISIGCYQSGKPCFSFVMDVMADVLYSAYAGEGAYKNGQRLGQRTPGTDLSAMVLSTPNVLDAFLRNYPWQQSLLRLADQVRAVRSLGSVALELCAVAEGAVDIFAAMRSAPWDHNGARLILLEAGCYLCALGEASLPVNRETAIFACRSQETFQMLRESYQF